MSTTTTADLWIPYLQVIDGMVELYLSHVIQPFLTLHEKFYNTLNSILRTALDANAKHIPAWFTANFITYARTVMVIPTLILLSWGHVLVPACIVIVVDFGDFLDGVVARYWNDVRTKQQQEQIEAEEAKNESRSASPANSDKDSFEVVTTGSPQLLQSWIHLHRNRSYGGFVDAVMDKAYLIPCWIALLATVPTSARLKPLQCFTLWALILAETASGSIRFKAYYTSAIGMPKVEGLDFSTSAVTADHVGKAKQTFQMVGTSLFILPMTRFLGLLLLLCAVPLAYESVRRKVRRRVIYCQYYFTASSPSSLNHKMIRFWMQAATLGSTLIVGVPGEHQTEQVLNACACSAVEHVLAEAPTKVDLHFLETYQIDYCLAASHQPKFVTEEVVQAKRFLQQGEDGTVRPVLASSDKKEH